MGDLNIQNQDVEEPVVTFKALSDITRLGVNTPDGVELMNICGYGLKININRDMINSVDDVEALLDGIKYLYRKLVMDSLLSGKQEKA